MKKNITVKNDLPHLIAALWDHPECPAWLQDVIWDGIDKRIDGGTKMTPTYWASMLESATPDQPGEHEEKYGLGSVELPEWPDEIHFKITGDRPGSSGKGLSAWRIRLVRRRVKDLRAKYGIEGAVNRKMFRQICRGENIIVSLGLSKILTKGRFAAGAHIHLRDEGCDLIGIAGLEQRKYDAFTACHELGHVLMSHSQRGSRPLQFLIAGDYDGYENSWPELEANYFAELLTEVTK